MNTYYDLIKSKAVKEHLLNNDIKLTEYQILSLIKMYSKFEQVVIDLCKEWLPIFSYNDVLAAINYSIDKYNEAIKFFESDNLDKEYIYILESCSSPAKSERYFFGNETHWGTFDSFQKAKEKLDQIYKDEDKEYKYTIFKLEIGTDNMYSIEYATREGEDKLSVLETNYHRKDELDDNVSPKGIQYVCSESPYIDHPFKPGDRIKPVHFNDIDTSMCPECEEDTIWKSDKQYDPDVEYWFCIDESTEEKKQKAEKFDEYTLDWLYYDSETGLICDDNEGLSTFLFDYEEQTIDPKYTNCFNADSDLDEMRVRLAFEIQELIKGNNYRIQDVVECSHIISKYYRAEQDHYHYW